MRLVRVYILAFYMRAVLFFQSSKMQMNLQYILSEYC